MSLGFSLKTPIPNSTQPHVPLSPASGGQNCPPPQESDYLGGERLLTSVLQFSYFFPRSILHLLMKIAIVTTLPFTESDRSIKMVK